MSARVPSLGCLNSDTDVTGEHQVTLNVSLLQAVESTDKDGSYKESVRDGERKKIYESPIPTHHFHMEYKLLPGKNAQMFKTDVVTFSNIVAKVYTDRDSRVVQCWKEEEEESKVNYYGWRHKHTFKVNKAQLLEIYDHVLEVRVWNTKSKLSARAKYDRPKAFRIPIRKSPLKGDLNEESDSKDVPGIVKRPSKFAVVYHDQVRRMKTNKVPSNVLLSSNTQTVVPTVSIQNSLRLEESNLSVIEQEASRQSTNQTQGGNSVAMETSKASVDIKVANSSASVNQLVPVSSSVAQSTSIESEATQESNKQQVISRRKQKRLEAEAAEEARIEREGIAVLRLKLLDLFGKHGTTKVKLDSSVKDLKLFEVRVSVTDTLLTEQLSRELNPMMITVIKATGLPPSPVPYDQLQQRCDPVFVRYKFHTRPSHCTHGVAQGSEAVWNDTHVVLLGTIDQQLLIEYLRGPPLVLELHDRSERSEDRTVPTLFGKETRDDVLGTHAFAAGLSHASPTVALQGGDKPWSSYGVARLDLSGLLQGQRVLELTVPVTNGPRYSTETQQTLSADPLPPGDYITSQCQLKVLVEVSHPLHLGQASGVGITPPAKVEQLSNRPTLDKQCSSKTTPEHTPTERHGAKRTPESSPVRRRGNKASVQLGSNKLSQKGTPEHTSAEKRKSAEKRISKVALEHRSERSKILANPPLDACPFNRAIYVFLSKGAFLVENLIAKVNQINAKALSLDSLSGDVLPAALSTYKLTRDQMTSTDCDIVTGFHVEDREQHIVVLEGLKNKGLRKIWEELPHHPTEDDSIQKVLYNSEFEFSQRLYAGLDVDLAMIRLFQPLRELTRQSLIYIKDALPDKCFRALMTLNELSYVNEMSDVTRNDLFPKPEEVTALSLQFGLPASMSLTSSGEGVTESDHGISSNPTQSKRERVWKPLDLANPHFEQYIQEREGKPAVDFIAANKFHVLTLSEASGSKKLHRSSSRQRSLSETATVHNYSTQTFNSVRLAKARLRERLALDPDHRYTYCQHYHSRTVVPVDIEAEQKAQRQHEKRKWRTSEGFVFPGVLSTRACNVHPKRPHFSRVESLQECFEDNRLHANTLKPTVEWMQFGWENRHEDFERWKRPPSTFGPPLPVSVHLAGVSRAREIQETLDSEQEEWRSKLVISNPRFEPHRCGIGTELTESGPKASTQLDRLRGMLKDPPKKHSLKQGGFLVHDMPALSVVHNPRLADPDYSDSEDDMCKRGYVPGPAVDRSLKLDSNVIPLTNAPREGLFTHRGVPKHPRDFRLYYYIPVIPAGAMSGVTQD